MAIELNVQGDIQYGLEVKDLAQFQQWCFSSMFGDISLTVDLGDDLAHS